MAKRSRGNTVTQTNEENPVSDVDVEFETEAAPEAPAEAAKANDQNAKTSNKHPLPDGWETPTAFAHRLTEVLEGYDKANPFKPQMVYGYVKNGKDFPQRQHTDGRFIVNIEQALEWVNVRVAKRKEREAAKAAAAAAAPTEAPAEAVVEGDATPE